MAIFGKGKKKNTTRGKFESIEVDGKALPILNFYLYTNKDEGKRYIELSALEEVPELHFSEIEMDVILSEKRLHLRVAFVDAYPKSKFKVYKFEVLSVNEYFR